MGKFLPAILATAGAIGGAIVGSILGGPIGASIGAAVGSSLGGLLGNALYNPPSPPAGISSVKQPRPPRVSAYGQRRLFGAYILYDIGRGDDAWDVFAVHDGPMNQAVDFYIGEDIVYWKPGVTYPGGLVVGGDDGRYADDTTRFFYTDGQTPGTTIPLAISDLPGVWTAQHRGDGVCLIYTRFASVKAKNYLKRYPQGPVAASIVAQWQKCPDAYAVDPTDESQWTYTENVVRHLLHYKLKREGIDYATKIAPTIAYWRTAQDVCDEAITVNRGTARLTAKSDSGDSSIVLSNVSGLTAGSVITFTGWNENRTVSSVSGNIVFLTASVSHDYPIGSGAAWIGGGTEPRYRSCISHNHTQRHAEVNSTMLSTCDGWMATRQDGALVIYAGKYYTPTVTIGPEHIVSYEWNGVGVDDDEAVNEYVCSYVSRDHDYNSVECDAWRDEDDIADRGRILSQNLDIQTPSWGQVRRLAKRSMARTNALYRGTIVTNVAGRIARGQRYISLHLEEAGTVFYSGPAEITAVTRNMETGGLTFSWVAADPNIDNWNAATEEGYPAAIGDRIASQPLTTPVINSAIYDYTDSSSTNGAGARIRIIAQGPDRTDLIWYVRWKTTVASVWGSEDEYSDTDAGPLVELLTNFVSTDADIEVQVAYKVGDGRVSDWSASAIVSTEAFTMTTEDGADEIVTEDGANSFIKE